MLYASIHSEVNWVRYTRWASADEHVDLVPVLGKDMVTATREGCTSFQGMWQSTGHQQGSLKVETFRLPFWPPLAHYDDCVHLANLYCNLWFHLWYHHLCMLCGCKKWIFFLFLFFLKSSPMLEALWFSDYTLNWESELLSLSFSFCISPVHNVGDTRDEGLTPGSGRSLGEGNGNPLQYSCLENPMDTGATVHRVTESDMTEWLNNRREIQDSHPWNWHFIPFQLTVQSQLFLGGRSKIMIEEANDFCM